MGLGLWLMSAIGAADAPASASDAAGARIATAPTFVGSVLRGHGASVHSGGAAKTHVADTLGQGVCVLDLDRAREGVQDFELFVPNGSTTSLGDRSWREGLRPWTLWRNRYGTFEREAGWDFGESAWGVGCAVADVDGDGFDDLFVATLRAPDRVLLRRPGRRFEMRELPGYVPSVLSAGGTFADFDLDGDLDLVVSTYLDETTQPRGDCRWKAKPVTCGPKGYGRPSSLLFRNDGRGFFVRTAALADHGGYGLATLMVHVNDDLWPDLFVANDSSPNHLFLNRGELEFAEAGVLNGVALSDRGTTQAAMGADAGDLDGDLVPDIVVTNFVEDTHNFYRATGNGQFLDQANPSGLAKWSYAKLGWSVLAEDFDLDGDLDLLTTNGHVYPEAEGTYQQTLQLLLNDGRGRFHEHTNAFLSEAARPMAGRGAATLDLDSDGDLDVVVARDGGAPIVLENQTERAHRHWVRVLLKGPAGNPRGLGARVTVEAEGLAVSRTLRAQRGYLSSSEPILTFGLGTRSRVDSIVVIWPDGTIQRTIPPAASMAVEVEYPSRRPAL